MTAKTKVTGPYKVVKVGEDKWKVVRIIGQHPSLKVIEGRYKAERAGANYRPTRPARPALPGRPERPMGERPAVPQHDEAYWAEQRTLAGQEIIREVDGSKPYTKRQAAYRRSIKLNKQYQEDLENSYEEPEPETEEEQSEYITEDEIKEIKILQGTFGCSSGNHASIDPYYDRVHWHKAVHGDGGSYSGVLETVQRQEGESLEDLLKRAGQRANELDAELHCSRCYYIEK